MVPPEATPVPIIQEGAKSDNDSSTEDSWERHKGVKTA